MQWAGRQRVASNATEDKKGGFFSIAEGESVTDGKRALFYLEEEDREGGKKKISGSMSGE